MCVLARAAQFGVGHIPTEHRAACFGDLPFCKLELPLPSFMLRDMDASFTIEVTDSMQGCLRRVQIALAWLRGHSA